MAAKAPAPTDVLRTYLATLAGGLPRVSILRGEERWFRERAIAAAVAAAEKAGLEVVRHDGRDPDFDLRALISDLTEAPMFSPARCVFVRAAAPLLKKEGDAEPPLLAAAVRFATGSMPSGVLVVDAEGLRADNALAKKAAAAGSPVLEFRRLYDQPASWERNGDPRRTELVLWLAARARERGITLSPDEALYVCAATGNDLSALDAALSRLEGRGKESVRSLVAWEAGAAPWDVADAIVRGDAQAAVAGIETMLRGGFAKGGEREIDPGALFAMLFGSVRGKAREALLGARAAERGDDPVSTYKGPPFGRDDYVVRTKARSAEGWERFLDDFAALERKQRGARDLGGGDLGVHDLTVFALRWRVERRGRGR